ncbi:Lysine-specific demethylase 5A [Cichlidogyrus casuarinus]|uniref:[histone H3]-trimethyl-L-lysine(4) demethylase n=1 Tax=Cichlidogyrus casuarinus TaxID=1844966 RepID=A0ABD2Q6Y1_9PLAT
MPESFKDNTTFRRPPSCPIFDPTKEEFEDALAYINKISKIGVKYGIVKIRPPTGWRVPFAIDEKNFTFTPRIQNLGDVGAYNRLKASFVTGLLNYWKVQGVTLYALEIKGRQIDVHSFWKVVNKLGGYQQVCENHLWTKVCEALDLTTTGGNPQSLQSKYKKIILPYEEFKRNLQDNSKVAKKVESEVNKRLSLSHLVCKECDKSDHEKSFTICAKCGPMGAYHYYCLDPPLTAVPKGKWYCKTCFLDEFRSMNGAMFGFSRSTKRYTLQRFNSHADEFKKKYFGKPTQMVQYEEAEREFWRLINDETTDLPVEYGADLSVRNVGSGFPTKYRNHKKAIEKDYIDSTWNLNTLSTDFNSALRFMPRDISGMVVPWVYVGMCFSFFCWHIEDHWSYSINYNHLGEPKTWYGISSQHAEHFDNFMKEQANELFESAPDLLHHMTMMMCPSKLMDQGIPIYRADQFPGEFIITFPRAYHAGFNQGFNVAEAVNFCPHDWLEMGKNCITNYSLVKRPPVFAHSELLCRMAAESEQLNVEFLMVVSEQLRELLETEKTMRRQLVKVGVCRTERMVFEDWEDERRECNFCRTTLFTSGLTCRCKKMVCLEHYQALDCCPASELVMRYRYDLEEFNELLTSLDDRLNEYLEWDKEVKKIHASTQKLDTAAAESSETKPALHQLEHLVAVGKQRNYSLDQINTLQKILDDVNQCAEVFLKIISSLDSVDESNTSFDTGDCKRNSRSKMRVSRPNCVSKITLSELEDLVKMADDLPCLITESSSLKSFHGRVQEWCENTKEILLKVDAPADKMEEEEEVAGEGDSVAGSESTTWSVCNASPHLNEILATIEKLHELRNFSQSVVVQLPDMKRLTLVIECVEWLKRVQDRFASSLAQDAVFQATEEKPAMKQEEEEMEIDTEDKKKNKTEEEEMELSRETLVEPLVDWQPRKRQGGRKGSRKSATTGKRARTSQKDQLEPSAAASEDESLAEEADLDTQQSQEDSNHTPEIDAHFVQLLHSLKSRHKLGFDEISKLRTEGTALVEKLQELKIMTGAQVTMRTVLQAALEDTDATLKQWHCKALAMKALIDRVIASE